jgi:hypothetical protein
MKKLVFAVSASLVVLACGGDEAPATSDDPVGAGPGPMGVEPAATTAMPGSAVSPTPVVAPDPGGEVLLMEEPEVVAASGIRPGDPVDLLFVVDNSTSMGDKQALFADAVPDLVDMLVHPPCLDELGDTDAANDVLVPEVDGSCPDGTSRAFAPVTDIHIGVISSSLGAHGLVTDPLNPDGYQCPDELHQNDRSYLIPLVRPEVPDLLANSYQGLGFLVWDPDQEASPPGDADQATLVQKFQAQVSAVRETGCGFEAQLEAAYRFLVDPAPHQSLSRVACSATNTDPNCVAPMGVDQEVLTERSNFLRPNSHLVITFLTDENDCSIRDTGQGYYAMRPISMSKGTAACAVDPNDNCCQSCGAQTRDGCDADTATNGCTAPAIEDREGTSDDMAEAYNVRCFDQKRRFGMDFLYPVARYTEGFTLPMVTTLDGSLVPNPLFAGGRTAEQVFVVGIVGTPWQDVTIDPADPAGTVPRADRLNWDLFLPSETSAYPLDPFNLEAIGVRNGTHPITGDLLGDITTTNPINGFDRAVISGDGLTDDLQYACTFELPTPRDCTAIDLDANNCDCTQIANPVNGEILDYATGNPLCQAPDGSYGTVQYRAKAYPGTRIMQLVRDMGKQAVLGSICPRNPKDPSLQDYGYRPPIRALLLGLGRGVL